MRLPQISVSLMLSFASCGAACAASLEDFATPPPVLDVALSPSGKYFSIAERDGQNSIISTFDAAADQRTGIMRTKDAVVEGVYWLSDERIAVISRTVTDRSKIENRDRTFVVEKCLINFVDRDGKAPVTIPCLGIEILSLRGPEPDTILVQSGGVEKIGPGVQLVTGDGRTDVYKINTRTGDATKIEDGNSRTSDWLADGAGQVRLRIDRQGPIAVYNFRPSGSTEWVELGRKNVRPFEPPNNSATFPYGIYGFGAGPNELYVSSRQGDTKALAVYDAGARALSRVVLQDPKWDIDGVTMGRDRRVNGAQIVRWGIEREYFEPGMQTLQREIKGAYPGHLVLIAEASDDRQKALAFVEGPQFPGGAYLYVDLASGTASPISRLYPNLKAADLGAVRQVTYKARDGLSIDAYLTMPAGTAATATKLPVIVMPHGGPFARDNGDFDWWVQFLANRGYAVFQPQFRGSEGYGRAFEEAGRYQWGLKMQDDVSDGLKQLVETGVADPQRVCIFGWSYGGYAAMAAATFTPDLFRCVIAGAGVANLLRVLDQVRKGDPSAGPYQYWRNHIGYSGDDFKRLKATSPEYHVDAIKAPILLLHGDQDGVVYIGQSEGMEKALKAAGKTYEFVRLEGEDHNLSVFKTRVQAFKAIEAFLQKYNPPD